MAEGTTSGETPAATSETLGAILDQTRRLFDLSGCAFLIVEGDRIRPAAAWFSSAEVAGAMGPILDRGYEPERPGLTEAAIERAEPLVLRGIEDWDGAEVLRERLRERLDAATADIAWAWYRRSSLAACPVRTAAGRVLGVLAIASERALGPDDLRAVDALAGLAAVALERSELLEREAARAHEELLLGEAAREMPASLELADVRAAIIRHAGRLAGGRVELELVDPTRPLELHGPLREGDRLRLPIALGPRPFGVLTVHAGPAGPAGADELRRLEALAPLAAGALANALDFAQERRIARALARGFVPLSPPELGDYELGVLYEPADVAGGGGDFFGVWRLRDGATAVLVGDVSGKGLEVSATSAMTRFFTEARAWDASAPAEILGQVNALLCARGPGLGFATAFLGVLDGQRLRYANAGHLPPLVRRAGGTIEELPASGVPLAVDQSGSWEEACVELGSGDLLFAASDGLTEARRGGEIFGEARVRELVAAEGARRRPQELVELAHRAAVDWASRVRDDIVVLAIARR